MERLGEKEGNRSERWRRSARESAGEAPTLQNDWISECGSAEWEKSAAMESTTEVASERAGERKNEGEVGAGWEAILPTPLFFVAFFCLAGALLGRNWGFETSGGCAEEGVCGEGDDRGLSKARGKGADRIECGTFPIL